MVRHRSTPRLTAVQVSPHFEPVHPAPAGRARPAFDHLATANTVLASHEDHAGACAVHRLRWVLYERKQRWQEARALRDGVHHGRLSAGDDEGVALLSVSCIPGKHLLAHQKLLFCADGDGVDGVTPGS